MESSHIRDSATNSELSKSGRGRMSAIRIYQRSGVNLGELLAFLAGNNEPDDVMHIVNGRIWNRGEIQVATLYIGAVHLIEPLPDLRGVEDVAGRHLEHRAKLLFRKNVIVPEAYLTSAILRSCKDVECDNELMCSMLVWQLPARWLKHRLKITIVLQALESYTVRDVTQPFRPLVQSRLKISSTFPQVHTFQMRVTPKPDINQMDSGCGLTNAVDRSQPEHRTQQDAPNHAENCSAECLPSITDEIKVWLRSQEFFDRHTWLQRLCGTLGTPGQCSLFSDSNSLKEQGLGQLAQDASPLPLALVDPASNRRGSSGDLPYSYVNESRGRSSFQAKSGLKSRLQTNSLLPRPLEEVGTNQASPDVTSR